VSRPGQHRRVSLPTDDALWRRVRAGTFTLLPWSDSRSNNGCRTARAQLEERGWRFARVAHIEKQPTHAPCRHCGVPVPIDGRTDRACDACAATAEPWRADYERERARVAAKRAQQEDRTHEQMGAYWRRPSLFDDWRFVVPRQRDWAA
jgi:hypothetical protein